MCGTKNILIHGVISKCQKRKFFKQISILTESKWISQWDYRCFQVSFPSYTALRDCNFHIICKVVMKVIYVRKRYLGFSKNWDFDSQLYLNEIKSNCQINLLFLTFKSLLLGNNTEFLGRFPTCVDRRFVGGTFEEMKPKITKSFASKG